jgi:hypothetical protein
MPEPSKKIVLALAWFMVFYVPFQMNANYIFNHFYHEGAYAFDSGWYAYLVHHNIRSRNPFLGADYGFIYTYASTHISLLLKLASLVFFVVPATRIEAFAYFEGAIYASIALAVFSFFILNYRPDRYWQLALGIIIALGTVFCAPTLSGVGYPHYEASFAAGALAFFGALIWGSSFWAWFFFVVTLGIREDFGLQLFFFLATLFAYETFLLKRPWKKNKDLLVFGAVGVATTCLLFHVKSYFPGDNVFARIYSGVPPYAHLTVGLVWHRLDQWAHIYYFWAPWFVIFIWGLWRKSRVALVGLVACIPWTLMALTAFADGASIFDTYHGFPTIVATIWPLFGFVRQARVTGVPFDKNRVLVIQAGLLVFSFAIYVLTVPFFIFVKDMLIVDSGERQQIEHFVTIAEGGGISHDHTLFDQATLALIPDNVFRNELIDGLPHPVPDNLWFYSSIWTRDFVLPYLLGGELPYNYNLPGTRLMLARRTPLPPNDPMAPLLIERGWLKPMMTQNPPVGHNHNLGYIGRNAKPGLVLFGPGIDIPPGHWRLTLAIDVPDQSIDPNKDLLKIEIAKNVSDTIAEKTYKPGSLKIGHNEVAVPFVIDGGKPAPGFEISIYTTGTIMFQIVDMNLLKE